MSFRTPAGIQSAAELTARRRFAFVSTAAIYIALLVWLGALLSDGGFTFVERVMLAAFAVAAPWNVLGVFNAALGFWLLHGRQHGVAEAAPFLAAGRSGAALSSRIAVLMTIRNEDAARAIARFRIVRASVDATGEGARFDWFVLSDTDNREIAAREEEEIARWRAESRCECVHYRRRMDNRGYKAGNIRDFCERMGADFDFMVPLDADSLMDGETLLSMARICEAYPRLGILQSLVVGAPSASAFARIFQFGMRHGMRSYTLGASWWSGDCGPFWGHNAVVRIAPFLTHCRLPPLKGGADILSHDQIEAVLMRRGGYEVRVLPIETGSFEENPPSLVDFVRRDLRWCRGNMQYVGLWGLTGLLPMSRFQLVWAVSMFIGAPAWTMIILLTPLAASHATGDFQALSAQGLYLTFLGLHLSPKLAGFADVLLSRGGLIRYGGSVRFLLGVIFETFGSFIIGAVTTFSVTLFLFSLPFGERLDWGGQSRDLHTLSFADAARAFWPHTLFGALLFMLGFAFAPGLVIWSLPLTAGYLASIPFALATAAPAFGAFLEAKGLFATPEELANGAASPLPSDEKHVPRQRREKRFSNSTT